MLYYKIIYQKKKSRKKIYEKLNIDNIILGNKKNSMGVFYTPTMYEEWICQKKVLKLFKEFDIIQTIVSNEKFKGILDAEKNLNLTFTDCEFFGFNSEELEELLQYEPINNFTIFNLLSEENYKLKKMIFRTRNGQELFINRNGVIGIDESSSEKDLMDIKLLIDFINIGPKVFQ